MKKEFERVGVNAHFVMNDVIIKKYTYCQNSYYITRSLYKVSGTAGNLARYYVRSGHYYISDCGYTSEPHYMDLQKAVEICFA